MAQIYGPGRAAMWKTQTGRAGPGGPRAGPGRAAKSKNKNGPGRAWPCTGRAVKFRPVQGSSLHPQILRSTKVECLFTYHKFGEIKSSV